MTFYFPYLLPESSSFGLKGKSKPKNLADPYSGEYFYHISIYPQSNRWQFNMHGDCYGVSASNGIVVHLKIGDFEGRVRLNVEQRTLLKYSEEEYPER